MASRPFQFLEKKRSKIRKRASKHFEGLAALSTHSAGQRAEVKAGCKPVHFSLETLHKTGLFSDIRLYNREGVKLYSSLETPSISPKETLERKLNRKVSGKEIQPTLERIEQKMVQNQHQETPEFKAIQQKMESLQSPTPPIRGHWNIHTENSGRKPNNYWAIKLVVRFFCLAFSILVD